MRMLRFLGMALGALVALILLAAMAARFSDGPIAILAGGPLQDGPLVEGPEPDWSFARDLDTIELQLVSPPRSRTTWVLESDGRLYVPCGYMNSAIGRLWKQWPVEAERDGRAIVRIAGKRYPRQLMRITDPPLVAALVQELRRKYQASVPDDAVETGGLWLFELAAPDRSASG